MRYRLEKDVPWSDILKTLSRCLKRQTREYERIVTLCRTYPEFEVGRSIVGEKLQEILTQNQQLRAFLGLVHQTKAEQDAKNLLMGQD